MQGLRQVLREAAEKPDASRLPKLPQRGRKAYDLSNEEIESLLMAEDAKRWTFYGRFLQAPSVCFVDEPAVCRQFGSSSVWLS
jgi:hypothetical protein